MRPFIILSVFLLGNLVGTVQSTSAADSQSSIYDFTMETLSGDSLSLSVYRGNVLLVVNVASKCGYTPQYKGLQQIYEKFKKKGLVVLGFPANNFANQEPGSDAEIRDFCTTNYGVTFPMFSKISVKGSDQHPLYTYLTSKETNPEFAGKITWNFNKFLINRDGKIISRFQSSDKPESDKVIHAIESAL